jgi:hypothetical protein
VISVEDEALMTGSWQMLGFVVLAMVLAGAPAGGSALAAGKGASGANSGGHHSGKSHSGRHHHHRSRSKAAFGAFWSSAHWPWWNYPSYYPLADMPIEYIERGEQETRAADHWLYCAKAQSYFPHVGECAEGWERVPAAPLQ